MKTVRDLLKRVPAPKRPVSTSDITTKGSPSFLRFSFPESYYEFFRKYGSGHFMAGGLYKIIFLNPFDANFESNVTSICDSERRAKKLAGDRSMPFPLFPKREGIFPIAGDDTGNYVFCRPFIDHQWSVITIRREHDSFLEEVYSSFIDFLVFSFMGRGATNIWPDLEKEKIVFVPEPLPSAI